MESAGDKSKSEIPVRPPADRRETASLAADPLAELLKRRGVTEVYYFASFESLFRESNG